MGYSISQFLSGQKLSVNLHTENIFAAASNGAFEDRLVLQLTNDIDIRAIKHVGSNNPRDRFKPRKTVVDKIASVADPECATKVAMYVAAYHLALLDLRMAQHTIWCKTLEDQIKLVQRYLSDIPTP